MDILVTDGMDPGALAALRAAGHRVAERFYPPEELGAALGTFDAVVVRSATKIHREQLESARKGRLKLIVRGGVGLDNIDTLAAGELGIAVRNTPNAAAGAVAELTMGLMLCCARFLSRAGASMRQGTWEKKACSGGFELRGKTLGIVGRGRIGRRVGELAQGFGMKVLFWDLLPENRTVSLDILLAQSDILTLHIPPQERPFLDENTIARMKDGAVVVNTSRGCNVDEAALYRALCSGKLRAAGLDVWASEPGGNPRLCAHPAVSSTPHLGASTREAQERIGKEILEILRDFENSLI